VTSTGIKALQRTGRRGAGGRPTREEAEVRDVRLLVVATHLFMERGFDGTSIDAVAEAAGISKPTVYARYHDKRDLFAAVLRKRIRDWLAPLSAAAEAQATEAKPKSIKTTLHELSRHMIAYTRRPARCCGSSQRRLSNFLSWQNLQMRKAGCVRSGEFQVFCVSPPRAVRSR
jgi:TetR/AcrR family transcriptional regulator, mexJK operon transcriptional repressor